MEDVAALDTTARNRALAVLLLGEGTSGTAEADTWAMSVVATGIAPQGWDPTTFPAGWQVVLAAAGVPLARGGLPWTARIRTALSTPQLRDGDLLELPSLERFATLTSLPLKPVRHMVATCTGVRLQTAVGVQLWLWQNQAALVNIATVHRSGFIHGPQRGMRSVVALDPGQGHVISW